MPDIAFKLFMFLLLQVNHASNQAARCEAGEGWITYRMIKENCCDPQDPPWADSTISRALKHLEKGGYIQRVKLKNGLAQRIRIVNWHKYQSNTTIATQEASLEVPLGVALEVPLEVALGVALDKQEGLRMPRREEEEKERPAAQISSTSGQAGESWVRWYERKFAVPPPRIDMEELGALHAAGATDALIVAVIERALALKKTSAARWAKTVVSGLLAYDVKTVEDWRRHEEEQAKPSTRPEGGRRPRSTDEVDSEVEDKVSPESAKISAMVKAQNERLLAEAHKEDPRELMRRENAAARAGQHSANCSD
jgi:hypothetical protein